MNGIGPEVLQFFRDEIVQPVLDMRIEMQDRFDAQDSKIDDLDVKVNGLISTRNAELEARKRRKDKAWAAAKWVGATLATIATAVIGARGL